MISDSAKVLAKFIDILNEHGPYSEELRAFRVQYETDSELVSLFFTAVRTQVQLQTGLLK